MADLNAKILPLYTETAGRVPDDATLTSLGKAVLDVGEMAFNIADQKIYVKDSGGNIVEMASPPVVALSALTDVDVTTIAPSEGSLLVYNTTTSKWETGDPPATAIREASDYVGEERLPQRLEYDEDAAIAAGKYFASSATTLDVHAVDKNGYDQAKYYDSLPSSGTLFTSQDNVTFTGHAYTSKTYSAVVNKYVFGGLSVAVSATPVLYLTFAAPTVAAEQDPRVGELLSWDGADWTPAPVTDELKYGLNNLKGVNAPLPGNGQALVFDGAEWVPGNATAGGSIDALDDVDTTTTAPTDGQVLTWVAANNQFEPANSVSRIQDASDFELNPSPSTTHWEIGQFSAAGKVDFNGNEARFDPIDADGTDWTSTFTEIVNGTRTTVWVSSDQGATWQEITPDGFDTQYNGNVLGVELSNWNLYREGTSAGSKVWFAPSEPAVASEPLADGDFLAWDSTDQKFKPTQSAGGGGASAMADLTDVDLTTNAPVQGNQLIYDEASGKWLPGGVTSGWLTTRVDEVEATASIADQTSADLTFDGIGEVGEFAQITVSEPAWVRFYPTATDRTNDGPRTSDTDPTPGSGVLLELITTTQNEVIKVTPGASYYNNETPTAEAIYCRVTNLSGASAAISVTVRAFAQVDFDGFTGGTYGSG